MQGTSARGPAVRGSSQIGRTLTSLVEAGTSDVTWELRLRVFSLFQAGFPKGDLFGNERLLLCPSCSVDLNWTPYSWVGEAGSIDKSLSGGPAPLHVQGQGSNWDVMG